MNMDRRLFLRNAALLAAGVIAADQVEIVERLAHQRRLFPAWPWMRTLHGDGIHDDTAALQRLFDGGTVWYARERRFLSNGFCVGGGQFRLTDTVEVNRVRGVDGLFHKNVIRGDASAVPLIAIRNDGALSPFSRHNNSRVMRTS